MGDNLLTNGVYWGYNPLTNHLLTSWDIPSILKVWLFSCFFSWANIFRGEPSPRNFITCIHRCMICFYLTFRLIFMMHGRYMYNGYINLTWMFFFGKIHPHFMEKREWLVFARFRHRAALNVRVWTISLATCSMARWLQRSSWWNTPQQSIVKWVFSKIMVPPNHPF